VEELETKKVIQYFNSHRLAHKIRANYIIVKLKFIFIFFKHKKGTISHINVTKIPSLDCLEDVPNTLQNKIFTDETVKIKSVKVDNITAVKDVGRNLRLLKIANNIQHIYNIRYNNERFPGIFVKLPIGTVIIFHTGKIVAVGSKNENNLKELNKELRKILRTKVE